ncbi:cytochrome b [Acetobacteraceae bacterium EV16G]|uniref:Cytochrome b n=1 Tax=Sorlinia euscelidii TaxID=3081148 RepID=A0ABU7U3D6_9PROT
MLQRLYHKILALSAAPNAKWWLFAVAFAEASFFPIPVDVLLIPMVLAQPRKAWRLATMCTVGSVLGGLMGWCIGAFLFSYVALPIAEFYHATHTLLTMQEKFLRYGMAIILLKGLTPIPFKIVTIAAGAAHYPIWPFLLACIVTRGGRFFLVAGLLRLFGAPIRDFIEKRLTLVLLAALVLIIGGAAVVFYF